ncbi:MAG: MoxR family ATPase [Gammaproteobacteria bacterium]|nr:MoxR family ATPase [Gammaproteobacteria bacterium]MBU1723271.1 MoxR family ATPase [Gammaproteobacteria bacterium]MBU2006566.1 MoxR family ATPase [Gammaproteobacteria bacterium]
MNDAFHIITKPGDWQQHDAEHLPAKRQALAATAPIADERNLDTSAERFRPSPALLNAINAALAARVPLLLTGEPGTGKTQVAWFIKRFFRIPLFAYQVHSNSQAADMRYDFDAVAYLRDAYVARHGEMPGESAVFVGACHAGDSSPDPRAQKRYLKPGALWQAYESAEESVLLIDEIDKAPRDFPNDLLQELDQNRFEHPFHQGEYVSRKGAPPIIIVTSNGERRLPDAFLRRCMVHHITLDKTLLSEIMQAWQSQFPRLDEPTRQAALKRFNDIRDINRLSKKPGAAELLLWLSVLSAQGVKAEALAETVTLKELPALMCLIKDHGDYGYL